jgi:RNA polymerase sigma-70 factor (ECF subfamily)
MPGREHTTDAELAASVARGDRRALEQLYRRHAPACIAAARRIVVDEPLAEEIAQEVFLRFWRRPDRYDLARGSVRTFLSAAARNAALDTLRSERSRRRREERVAGGPWVPSVDEAVLVRIDQSAVRAAMGALSADERVAISLAYYEGCSYREVARRLEQPEGTVKTRIRRGLHRMQVTLRAGSGEPLPGAARPGGPRERRVA